MKLIIAYVQPHTVPRLTQELQDIPGFPGMSVTSCDGFGDQASTLHMRYSPFHATSRLEIFSPGSLVDSIVDRIVSVAHSGNPGDGKVFIVDVVTGARIRTGESGPEVT